MKFSRINQYMYSAEMLVSSVNRIRTLTARYGSRSLHRQCLLDIHQLQIPDPRCLLFRNSCRLKPLLPCHHWQRCLDRLLLPPLPSHLLFPLFLLLPGGKGRIGIDLLRHRELISWSFDNSRTNSLFRQPKSPGGTNEYIFMSVATSGAVSLRVALEGFEWLWRAFNLSHACQKCSHEA